MGPRGELRGRPRKVPPRGLKSKSRGPREVPARGLKSRSPLLMGPRGELPRGRGAATSEVPGRRCAHQGPEGAQLGFRGERRERAQLGFRGAGGRGPSSGSGGGPDTCLTMQLAVECVFFIVNGRGSVISRGGECEIFFRSAKFDSGDVSGVGFSRYGGESFHHSSAHTFDDSFIRWHKYRCCASAYVPAVWRP